MYNMWPPPMMGYYPPAPASPTLEQVLQAEKTLKEWKKELKEEAEKDKKKKPTPIKFSLLEATGLMMILGPLVGFCYLYGLYYMIININQMIDSLAHAPH